MGWSFCLNEYCSSKQYFTLTCCLLLACLNLCTGYNLEPRLPLFKYGPPGSTFGFSIAQHRTSTDPTCEFLSGQSIFDHSSTALTWPYLFFIAGLADTLLVVGSPTAEALASQRGSVNPGGVFYCPVTTNPDDCTRVEMDGGGRTITSVQVKYNINP